MDQRSLLETKDTIVDKTKEKLARSAKMQARPINVAQKTHAVRITWGTGVNRHFLGLNVVPEV